MKKRALLAGTTVALVALGALASVAVAVADRQLWPHGARDKDRYRAVANYLRQHSAADARVFVWGNSPQIYLYAERRMGTRYPSVNYQTGRVWGTPANEVGGRPYRDGIPANAWENLLGDLERNRPDFIVDAAAGKLNKMDEESIARHPRMAALVAYHYVLAALVEGVPIYRRR
jgi:hypothetical protein